VRGDVDRQGREDSAWSWHIRPVRSVLPSRLAATAFAIAAAFHLLALAVPTVSTPSPSWRHALFVAVNGGYALAFVTRPRWLFLAFLPLAAQQIASHGSALLRAYANGWTDWQSAAVLLAMPLLGYVAYRARGTPDGSESAPRTAK
jgi:hypothetical protein